MYQGLEYRSLHRISLLVSALMNVRENVSFIFSTSFGRRLSLLDLHSTMTAPERGVPPKFHEGLNFV